VSKDLLGVVASRRRTVVTSKAKQLSVERTLGGFGGHVMAFHVADIPDPPMLWEFDKEGCSLPS
jgi:hypothetical protein